MVNVYDMIIKNNLLYIKGNNIHSKVRGNIPYWFNNQTGHYILPLTFDKEINKHLNLKVKYKKPEYNFNFKLPEFVMKHQKLAFLLGLTYKRFAFYLDTGTGKTLVGLLLIDYLLKAKKIKRPLVVCPLDLIESAWIEQKYEFNEKFNTNFDFNEIDLHSIINGKIKDKRQLLNYLNKENTLFLVNYETYINYYNLFNLFFDFIIFDESTRLQSYNTTTSRVTRDFCWNSFVKYVFVMAGVPTPNGLHEFYTQNYVLNKYALGDYYTHFLPIFFKHNYWRKPEIISKKRERLNEIIKLNSLFVDKREVLDLPPLLINKVYVKMTDYQQKIYNEVKIVAKSKFKFKIKVLGEDVRVANALTEYLKLRQITSGFVKNDDKVIYFQSNPKLKLLISFLSRFKNEKIIIWCNYIAEVEAIKKVLDKKAVCIYGNIKKKEVSIRRKLWQTSKIKKILVATVPKFQEGHNLQANCWINIFYSRSDSYKKEHQAISRTDRKGQNNRVQVYYFEIKGTIDTFLDKLIKQKKGIRDLTFQDKDRLL